jgi:hypothetical protein
VQVIAPKRARKVRTKEQKRAAAIAKLGPFLSRNTSSSVDFVAGEKDSVLLIRKPWNDPSVVFVLPSNMGNLCSALNNLILPEPYSAIYHTDKKEFEVAWTAFTLSPPMTELVGRKFCFSHKTKVHECAFEKSSDRLLTLAMHSLPVAASLTSYRNLPSFEGYIRNKYLGGDKSRSAQGDVTGQFGELMSFFIRNVEWSEPDILELVTTLNFYLKYYDSISPTILIHSSAPKISTTDLMPRYPSDTFPKSIVSNGIDGNLLNFWHASTSGDSGRRFVYSFRIIEYASHTYMKSNEKFHVKQILSTPHAFDDIDKLAEDVILKVVDLKPSEDVSRFNALISEVIKPEVLWQFVGKNIQYLSSDLKMEGGYCIPALVAPSATEQTFKTGGLIVFANIIRQIRNHLSHGRDQKTGHMIAPTPANFAKLEPWAALISLAANEIMLYLHLT